MSDIAATFFLFVMLPLLIFLGILSFYFTKDMIKGIRELKTFLKKRREH